MKSFISAKQKIKGLAFGVGLLLAAPATTFANFGDELLDGTVFKILAGIAWFIFWIAGKFMMIAGGIMDTMIRYALDSSKLTDLTVINGTWVIIRDMANMFFIFILLYIAIGTILRLSRVQWKQALANLIVVALLINFSFFFTNVIIDASNVLAVGFYNNIKTTINGATVYGPSSVIMDGVRLQTFFNTIEKDKSIGKMDNSDRALIYLAAALFQFITGFVFAAGAILFIIRFVVFIFLLILSPLAFVAMILQSTSGHARKWWSTLLNNAILAPVYLGMVYIVVRVIQSPEFKSFTNLDASTFALEFSNSSANMTYPVIMNFLIITAMMWFALEASRNVSASTTNMAMRWAKKGVGAGVGVGLAVSSTAGRQIGGNIARGIANSSSLKKAMGNKGFSGVAARSTMTLADKGANSTWDVRNTAVGGAAVGSLAKSTGINVNAGKARGKGGVQGQVDRKDKAYIAKQEKIAKALQADQDGNVIMSNQDNEVKKEARDAKLKAASDTFAADNKNIGKDSKLAAQRKAQYDAEVTKINKENIKSTALENYKEELGRRTEAPTGSLLNPKKWKDQSNWRINSLTGSSATFGSKGQPYYDRKARNEAALKRIDKGQSKSEELYEQMKKQWEAESSTPENKPAEQGTA